MKKQKIKNKNIIITGALGLLGSEFVKSIIKFEDNPILLDIDDPKGKRVKSLPEQVRKNYYMVDIANEIEIVKFINILLKKNIIVSGLVNNAAINPTVEENTRLSGFESFDPSDWQKEVGVGLTGAILMTKHVGSLMVKQKTKGSIVNISSDLGIIAPDQRLYEENMKKPVGYSVIKHGIIGLTKYTSTYWPGQVRCNALCPGGVLNGQPDEFLNSIATRIPMGRMAKKNEYNYALNFLLSDQSSYMTGQTIIIDGGRSVW